MTDSVIGEALKNWIPYRLDKHEDNPKCRWLFLGNETITEPFFADTIAKCKKLSQNSQLRRSISNTSVLQEWSVHNETLPPAAIIFHISRCGSTLVSQLLGLNPENIVLSEVPFFDELLRLGYREKKDISSELKAAISFYSNRRNETQKRVYIKTDSWHIHFYQMFRELYPDTPFVFLYRNPAEVLRSQQKTRGMHAVPGVVEPEIFGFDIESMLQLSLDEYLAHVLEGYFQKMIDIVKTDSKTTAIEYRRDAVKMMQQIAAFTGTALSDNETELIRQRSGFHGKYPEQLFAELSIEEPVPDFMKESLRLYEILRLEEQTQLKHLPTS